jgi:hypothetical protein
MNLRVAAAHFGYETTVMYQPRPEESLPVALVALRETCAPDAALRDLFSSIAKRHTNRNTFDERAIEQVALEPLCDFIDEHSQFLQFVVPHERGHAADLVADGNRRLLADSAFRAELSEWVRPNDTSAQDGICGDGLGIPGPISHLGPWLMRSFDLGPTQAKHDRDLVAGAAGLIAVTADDDRTSLLQAGEALERLLLLLTSLGLHYSFMNQPIEVKELRGELWSMIRSAKPPQLLLRIGYARRTVRPMPRRRVGSVVES